MSNAKCIGRIGALAVTLGVGIAVINAPAVVTAETASESTALLLGGSGIPTWNDADVGVIMNRFIAPTHPGQTIEPVAVTTPEEFWPGGLLAGPLVCLAICPGSVFGPGHSGGEAWVDAPWWKLVGIFDRTFDQSVQAGVADLEDAMADYGNDHLVIYGYSQGATVANLEKGRLAQQYPEGTEAPDIDFVLGGDPNLPNGGFLARFPGLYIPILDFSFNGAAPTDTQFDTVEINRQYDFMGDFPLYPLNPIADLNALLGFFYVHTYPFDVSLADPSASAAFQGSYGDSSYYFFETPDLPLFGPLRTVGVPESLIDVVEPFFKVIVELGYDRSIKPWEPTPARLIPTTLDPAKVATDLVNAIGEGIDNAAALIGAPPPLSIPAHVTLAAPATQTAKADISHQTTATDSLTQNEQLTSTGETVTNTGTAADPASVSETPTETVTETSHVTSTKKVIEIAKAKEASTGPRATPNPSVSAPIPKPAKPAGQPATPHSSNRRDHVVTAGPSSVPPSPEASPSTGSQAAGDGSSVGDADAS